MNWRHKNLSSLVSMRVLISTSFPQPPPDWLRTGCFVSEFHTWDQASLHGIWASSIRDWISVVGCGIKGRLKRRPSILICVLCQFLSYFPNPCSLTKSPYCEQVINFTFKFIEKMPLCMLPCLFISHIFTCPSLISFHLRELLLCNKLVPNKKSKHLLHHNPMCLEFGRHLARWFWLRIFHEVTHKVSAGPTVIWQLED
jgi:hypothetical protein